MHDAGKPEGLTGSGVEASAQSDSLGFESRWGHSKARGLPHASGNREVAGSGNVGEGDVGWFGGPRERRARAWLVVSALIGIAALALSGCRVATVGATDVDVAWWAWPVLGFIALAWAVRK